LRVARSRKPLVLFNVWDAGSAKAVAAAGVKAIATSSWSVANANGFSDGERIPLAVAINNLRRIVAATDLPVTVDLESGYGDSSEILPVAISQAIGAGAVGCNLEDSFPSNGKLRTIADQCERIRRARQTSDAAGFHFFINARTDVFFFNDRQNNMTMPCSLRPSQEHAPTRKWARTVFSRLASWISTGSHAWLMPLRFPSTSWSAMPPRLCVYSRNIALPA
jgi:2-methylisocitrate lyase-like PEP mutase family enzyme